MTVQTVFGPVSPADLGQTLVHEHVEMADWSMRAAFGERFYDPTVVLERAVEHFTRAKDCGVRTVVDGTPLNMGRDVALIREVAERTGLNFVVSSGFYYTEHPYLTWRSEDEVFEMLSRECRDGIADSGIRPGIMKAACAEDGLTPLLDKLFRGIGRTAAEHQLPIFVHHHPEIGNGDTILDVLEESGAATSQVILGHSGDSNDLEYLERMLERGCYLGMDRFGYCDVSNSLENRVRTIVELCARGYADQLLISHDLAIFLGVFGSWEDYLAFDPLVHGADFTFIHTTVLPALEAAGVEPGTVQGILGRNPGRLFGAQI